MAPPRGVPVGVAGATAVSDARGVGVVRWPSGAAVGVPAAGVVVVVDVVVDVAGVVVAVGREWMVIVGVAALARCRSPGRPGHG